LFLEKLDLPMFVLPPWKDEHGQIKLLGARTLPLNLRFEVS
jgi:hypothetical protein